MISIKNNIFTAAIMAEPQDAVKHLQRTLGIEDTDIAKCTVLDRKAWLRGSTSLRLQMLSQFLAQECYLLACRNESPSEFTSVEMAGTLD